MQYENSERQLIGLDMNALRLSEKDNFKAKDRMHM